MPFPCEKCSSFEVKLRELEADIQSAIKKRELGFHSEKERENTEAMLTQMLAIFHQTEASYELHKHKSHEISHRHQIRPPRKD